MEVTIIVPTYNRAEILEKCIKKLMENQFPINNFEIIVVDDSSTDNTQELTKKLCKQFSNLKYFKQKKSGQGVARNLGIENSNGDIIIFIGDDIFTTKSFILEHYKFHKNNPSLNKGMIGLTLWDPEIKITPYMKWSTQELTFLNKFGGHQFAFNNLKYTEPNYKYFYTSNISIKKALLKKHKFDPWFEGYGWEDIELGYRLEKNENLKLHYNQHALAYHHHYLDDSSLVNKMHSIGKAAATFQKKHPELNIIPKGKKLLLFKIISNNITITIIKTINKLCNQGILALLYYALSKKHFLEGINSNNK